MPQFINQLVTKFFNCWDDPVTSEQPQDGTIPAIQIDFARKSAEVFLKLSWFCGINSSGRFLQSPDQRYVIFLEQCGKNLGIELVIIKLFQEGHEAGCPVQAESVDLMILALGVDTSTPTGKLMLDLLGSVAEFERSMMLERQRDGIAKAKAEGKYQGRKPTARAKAEEVMAMKQAGRGATEIAATLGIGRASVYRILAE